MPHTFARRFIGLTLAVAPLFVTTSCGYSVSVTQVAAKTSTGGNGGSCVAPLTASLTAVGALTTPIKVPLAGCTWTDYTMPVNVGTTSSMNLIIDSGSTTLAVAGSSCTNCTGISPLYTPSSNDVCKTASGLYGDGSGWSGHIYNDTVGIGTLPIPSTSLVSITSNSSFFSDYDCYNGTTGTNSNQGIIGLAGSQIAITSTLGYLDALNSQMAYPAIFSVQLCSNGGYIWFGGADPTSYTGSMVYTPITTANNFFYVTLSTISVGSTSLGTTAASFPEGTVVDTGTTLGLFPTTVFNSIVTSLSNNASVQSTLNLSSANITTFFDSGDCLALSNSVTESSLDAALPTLGLTLASTTSGQTFTLNLPASRSYLDLHTWGGVVHACAGIGPDSSGTPAIIGGALLRSLVTVFDRSQARIGFATQTGCTL